MTIAKLVSRRIDAAKCLAERYGGQKKKVSYYEIFDNYLVLYWEHFNAEETKTINLDLKVEFAGTYTGKSSNVYLYYMPEAKYWNQGITNQY